jgi:hypothetical protein
MLLGDLANTNRAIAREQMGQDGSKKLGGDVGDAGRHSWIRDDVDENLVLQPGIEFVAGIAAWQVSGQSRTPKGDCDDGRRVDEL